MSAGRKSSSSSSSFPDISSFFITFFLPAVIRKGRAIHPTSEPAWKKGSFQEFHFFFAMEHALLRFWKETNTVYPTLPFSFCFGDYILLDLVPIMAAIKKIKNVCMESLKWNKLWFVKNRNKRRSQRKLEKRWVSKSIPCMMGFCGKFQKSTFHKIGICTSSDTRAFGVLRCGQHSC